MNRKKGFRVLTTVAMSAMLVLAMAVSSFAATTSSAFTATSAVAVDKAMSETGAYIAKTVPAPAIGTIGGEWAVISLARSGYSVPAAYYDDYYNMVVEKLKASNGVLHERKYTEYSRVILAMTAIGRDVTNVGGYNLLEKLADFEKTSWQGINGSIWALIALDSHDYEIPQVAGVKTQATRDLYIENILSKEITTIDGVKGGFALSGTEPDPDTTAMALIAFSNYQDRADVKAATDRALEALSKIQLADGGFATGGYETSESLSQVIVALSAMKINQNTDSRFIKGENQTISALMKYYITGGGFAHEPAGAVDAMGTEQALDAMTAYDRYLKGKNAMYDMSDVTIAKSQAPAATSNEIKVVLNGKEISFDQAPIIESGRTLVPMRAIFEALGADVAWDNTTRTVTGTLGDKTVKLTIGSQTAYVNENENVLDVPAKIVNGRTLVPVRFISESMEATVDWDGTTKTVTIVK